MDHPGYGAKNAIFVLLSPRDDIGKMGSNDSGNVEMSDLSV